MRIFTPALDIGSHINDQDQLPGRLRRLQPTEGDYAGPVNCIRWLRDILHLKIDSRPVFRHSKAAPAIASGRTGPTELAIWKGDRSSNDKYPRSSSGAKRPARQNNA
jgi:hypothetical protein